MLFQVVAIWIPIWIFVACGYDHVVANMFSVPLGILMGADLTVSEYIRKCVALLPTPRPPRKIRDADARGCRSLIAAWIGNFIGALLVALPATYFYLSTHTPIPGTRRLFGDDGLRGVEEGEGLNGVRPVTRHAAGPESASGSSGDVAAEKGWERRNEDEGRKAA